jgi:hypothetical protein
VLALRQGIGHDGRTLFPLMPHQYFRSLSDEDPASVIVYERSMAPVHIEQPKTTLTEDIKKTFQPLEPLCARSRTRPFGSCSLRQVSGDGGALRGLPYSRRRHGNPIPGMNFARGVDMSGPGDPTLMKIVSVASLNLTPESFGHRAFRRTNVH